jgi:flagellar protein FliS
MPGITPPAAVFLTPSPPLPLNAAGAHDNPFEVRTVDEVHRAYFKGRVQTADPLTLVRLLYDNALQSVRTARRMLQAGDIAARSKAISKASDCLCLLTDSLSLEQGGEISRNLLALYGYMQNRLLEANLQQADAPLAEVESLLATLQSAWAELAAAESALEVSAPAGV